MNQKKLGESLSGVVEDCVNKVGVDLNTASAPLLSYISGNQQYDREKYCDIPRGEWTFYRPQRAFKSAETGTESIRTVRRIYEDTGGKNPLDMTGVHPESYDAAEKLLKKQGFTPEDVAGHHLNGLSLNGQRL